MCCCFVIVNEYDVNIHVILRKIKITTKVMRLEFANMMYLKKEACFGRKSLFRVYFLLKEGELL